MKTFHAFYPSTSANQFGLDTLLFQELSFQMHSFLVAQFQKSKVPTIICLFLNKKKLN